MKESKLKVLFDSNIIIDVFTKRDGYEDSVKCFLAMAKGRISGYLVSKQITYIYYTLRKYLDSNIRKDVIFKMLNLFEILDLRKKDLAKALNVKGDDYEDNVLIAVGRENRIDCILSKDCHGFKEGQIKIVSPRELLNMFAK